DQPAAVRSSCLCPQTLVRRAKRCPSDGTRSRLYRRAGREQRHLEHSKDLTWTRHVETPTSIVSLTATVCRAPLTLIETFSLVGDPTTPTAKWPVDTDVMAFPSRTRVR